MKKKKILNELYSEFVVTAGGFTYLGSWSLLTKEETYLVKHLRTNQCR